MEHEFENKNPGYLSDNPHRSSGRSHSGQLKSAVVNGQPEAVNDIMRSLSLKLRTDYLCMKRTIIDCPGVKKKNFLDGWGVKHHSFYSPERRLEDLTLLQYALWAQDTGMVKTLLPYLSIDEQRMQLEELYNDGITVLLDGETRNEHRHHFDISSCTNAMAEYVASPTWGFNEFVVKWKNMGKLQRMLPRNLIQEYCHPDYSFSKERTFKEPLVRTSIFHNLPLHEDQNWDAALSDTADYQVGLHFTIFRGEDTKCVGDDRPKDMFTEKPMATNIAAFFKSKNRPYKSPYVEPTIATDLNALLHWDSVRKAEIHDLREKLGVRPEKFQIQI